MAKVTVGPSGRSTSRVAPAASYAAVASRYASTLRAAQQEQDNAALEELVLQYQQGEIPFAELQVAFKNRINDARAGTTKAVQLKEALATLTVQEGLRFKREKRAELEAKASSQGVTAEERYNIEKQMLQYETPGTQEYVQQQQNVINSFEGAQVETVEKEKARLLDKYGADGLTNEDLLSIVQRLRQIANPDSEIGRKLVEQEAEYRTKIVEEQAQLAKQGAAQAEASSKLQLQQLAETVFSNNAQISTGYQEGKISGLDADAALLANLKELRDRMATSKVQIEGKTTGYLDSQIADLTNKLTQRQTGDRIDILNKSNQIESVTLDELKRDTLGKYKVTNVRQDPKSGEWVVENPLTGESQNFGSKTAADRFAKDNDIYRIDVVRNDLTPETYFYNGQTDRFLKKDKNGQLIEYEKPVTIPELDKQFRITTKAPVTQPSAFSTALKTAGDVANNVAKTVTNPTFISAAANPVAFAGQKVQDAIVNTAKSSNFSLPSVPEFKLPELPKVNFSLPSFSVPQVSLPNINFTGINKAISNVGSTLSNFGSSVVSTAKNAASGLSNFLGGLFGRK